MALVSTYATGAAFPEELDDHGDGDEEAGGEGDDPADGLGPGGEVVVAVVGRHVVHRQEGNHTLEKKKH